MNEQALRESVIATARAMNAAGINRGKSGNVSTRWRKDAFDGYLVTPSAIAYDELLPVDIVAMPLAGDAADALGTRPPSTEWRFHRDIYRARDDTGAIVHVHSPFATSLACLHRGLPSFHYMIAIAGGSDIRCAPYATFGTQALSDRALAALEGRRACLLANHGVIALGGSLRAALALAVEVENLAEMYCRALQVGTPVLLDDAEMASVLVKFRSYDRSSSSSD